MDYIVSHTENIAIIRIKSERGTVKDANSVKVAIDKEIDAGFPNVVIDMSELLFVDSNFLGSLVTGLKRAIKAGGDLRLVGFKAPVKTMFELTRLYNIFRIYETTDEAEKSFSDPDED